MNDDPEVLLDFEDVLNRESAQIEKARFEAGQLLQGEGRVGLALSGGGIRSATFCLGVLQALAKTGVLKRIDYMSSVSGGGYMASFLSAWISRSSLDDVTNALAGRKRKKGEPHEAAEVTWLRRYSNYLAPKLGFFSADSLTLLATWLRNVLLNLVIFATFLGAVFLLPRLLLVPATFGAMRMQTEVGFAAAWLAFLIMPLGIAIHFTKYFMQDAGRTIILMNSTGGVFFIVILPGVFAAILGSTALFYGEGPDQKAVVSIALISAALLAVGGALSLAFQRIFPNVTGVRFSAREVAVFATAYGTAIAVGAALVIFFVKSFKFDGDNDTRVEKIAQLLTFGPPSLMLTLGAMCTVIVGLVGKTYHERTREWWSRLNAWFIIIGVAWLALVALAFYAAPVLAWAGIVTLPTA